MTEPLRPESLCGDLARRLPRWREFLRAERCALFWLESDGPPAEVRRLLGRGPALFAQLLADGTALFGSFAGGSDRCLRILRTRAGFAAGILPLPEGTSPEERRAALSGLLERARRAGLVLANRLPRREARDRTAEALVDESAFALFPARDVTDWFLSRCGRRAPAFRRALRLEEASSSEKDLWRRLRTDAFYARAFRILFRYVHGCVPLAPSLFGLRWTLQVRAAVHGFSRATVWTGSLAGIDVRTRGKTGSALGRTLEVRIAMSLPVLGALWGSAADAQAAVAALSWEHAGSEKRNAPMQGHADILLAQAERLPPELREEACAQALLPWTVSSPWSWTRGSFTEAQALEVLATEPLAMAAAHQALACMRFSEPPHPGSGLLAAELLGEAF